MRMSDLIHTLMVAYLYPPIDNVGVRRVVKFVKYLPDFGYRPVILTTSTRGSLSSDNERKIHRTTDLLGSIKGFYRGIKLRTIPSGERANIGVLTKSSIILRMLSNLLPPDPELLWYPAAVRKGIEVTRVYPIRVIYSTSPPETNHLVAMKIKKSTGLPWVADFRDGWMFEPLRTVRLSSRWRHWLERQMEEKVVQSADRIITATDVSSDYFAAQYPASEAKLDVITNGFDADDYIGLQRKEETNKKLNVVHTGSFSLSRSAISFAGFLEALEYLTKSNPEIHRYLQITLAGRLSSSELQAIEGSSARSFITTIGQKPYRQALQFQIDADLLLLIVNPDVNSTIPTKLYEYLAARRPVLGLVEGTTAGKLISQLGAGIVVNANRPIEIADAILTCVDKWKAGQLTSEVGDQIQHFERRHLTKHLSKIFDKLTHRGET